MTRREETRKKLEAANPAMASTPEYRANMAANKANPAMAKQLPAPSAPATPEQRATDAPKSVPALPAPKETASQPKASTPTAAAPGKPFDLSIGSPTAAPAPAASMPVELSTSDAPALSLIANAQSQSRQGSPEFSAGQKASSPMGNNTTINNTVAGSLREGTPAASPRQGQQQTSAGPSGNVVAQITLSNLHIHVSASGLQQIPSIVKSELEKELAKMQGDGNLTSLQSSAGYA
jgi:hypothetical protein